MTVEFEDQRGIAASADALAGPASPSQELAVGHRDDLEEIAIAVRGRMIGIREDVIAIGRDLLRAKALLEYGQWMPWLRAEFNMTSRTAENYMNLAERLGDRFETLSNLRLATVYRIVARSTPDAVIDAVIAGASSDVGLTDADAKAMLPGSSPPRPRKSAARAATAVSSVAEAALADEEAAVVTEAPPRPKPPVDPLNDWTTQAFALLTTQIKDKARLKTLTHLLPRSDIVLLVDQILDYLAPAP